MAKLFLFSKKMHIHTFLLSKFRLREGIFFTPAKSAEEVISFCSAFIIGVFSKNFNLPANGYQPLQLNMGSTDFQNDMVRNCKGRKGFFGPGSTLNPSYLLVSSLIRWFFDKIYPLLVWTWKLEITNVPSDSVDQIESKI